MQYFNPKSKSSARAVQAWQILVGMAMNRQTETYDGLAQKMFRKKAAGVLDKILGHIAYYCLDNNLPPLTVIVVNKKSGTPGSDIPIDIDSVDALREKVFTEDWYNVYPPAEIDLSIAFAARHSKD